MRKILGRSTIAAVASLGACGCVGSPSATSPSAVEARTAPAARIEASGNGVVILHPSMDRRFAVALETPIRIVETGGGSASWDFARMQVYSRGVEVERTELTADEIAEAGLARIAPGSRRDVRLAFCFNSTTFDRIDITLGFTDGRGHPAFTAAVPFTSFSGVGASATPLEHAVNPV